MKAYLNTLKRIRDEGYNHVDRTGTGRRSIVGVEIRHNMRDGFPLITTRRVFTRGMIEEMLFFIHGKTDIRELQNKGVHIWDHWAVTSSDIQAFIEKHAGDDEQLKEAMLIHFTQHAEGQIGPMYGAMWRNAPRSLMSTAWPKVPMDELPSDKIGKWKEEYEELKFLNKELTEQATIEDYCSHQYYHTCDQLNELVRNLKNRPFSSRLIVSAWIPEFVPFETMSPQENVMMGRGSLAACHAMFQCFVKPPIEEGGKKQLSLLIYQR